MYTLKLELQPRGHIADAHRLHERHVKSHVIYGVH